MRILPARPYFPLTPFRLSVELSTLFEACRMAMAHGDLVVARRGGELLAEGEDGLGGSHTGLCTVSKQATAALEV
jgi:hypothetical protein